MLALLQIVGTVFLDQNGSQRQDPGEPGIPRVAVSNQHEVVLTDELGRFRLRTAGTGLVFVSVPDGHRHSGTFWRPADGTPLQFGLLISPRTTTFAFVHGSDPHVQPSTENRLLRVKTLVDSIRPAFVLMSGDLIKDALRVGEAEATGYYDLYLKHVGGFGATVWSVPGNHELFGIERHHSLVSASHPLFDRGMYRRKLGPDYFSFNYGGIHFVGLNTVDRHDLWYYGHVDSMQVAWLAADLAVLPDSMPVITFGHIPLISTGEALKGFDEAGVAPTTIRIDGRAQFRHTVSNLRDLLALLWKRPYPLALQGHTHLREVIRYGIADSLTRFETAAAIVSGWRDGPIQAVSSVTVYRVDNGRVSEGTPVPLDPPVR